MRCIVCDREFIVDENGRFDYGDWDTFMPQYGSRHDMTVFKIFLCDDCIDSKLRAHTIEIIDNRSTWDE